MRQCEANFTNKLMKEASQYILPMRIERRNNFIDGEFVSKQDLCVIISDTNSFFVIKENTLIFKWDHLIIEKSIEVEVSKDETNELFPQQPAFEIECLPPEENLLTKS